MTPRPRRSLRQDGAAVSNVLGAILMFGLLVVTLVTVQVKFVPVWDREREAGLMQAVAGQFATLKSDLDRQADNRTSVPVTDPVTLSNAPGFRFFTSPGLPAGLAYAPAPTGGGFALSAPQVHILTQNGVQIFAGSETWTTLVSSGTVSNATAVQNLRLRIPNPASYTTGQSVTLTISDAADAYAGKLTLTNIDHGTDYTYEIKVYSASSSTTPVNIVQLNFDKNNPPAYQYIDLLVRDFQLNQVLASASTPFRVDLSLNGMSADYTISYVAQAPGGGTTQVGNTGRLVPNYAASLAGGSLTFTSHNNQYLDQTYILEHGAVVLAQPDGNAMQVPPEFTASLLAGQVTLTWVVPALTGPATTVSGPVAGTVTLQPAGNRIDITATAPSLTFTLTTLHPSVWTQYWTTTLQAAGLTVTGTCASGNPSNLQFCTSSTATSATLTVYGLQTASGSTVDDILLNLKGAEIQATPKAAGSG
jgi:hypothetical protein